MEMVTYAQLNSDIINNLYKIPRDVDLIVGVPRSGLLVANILALYLNKPMSHLDGFLDKTFMSVGNTKNQKLMVRNFSDVKKVIIVEDSVNAGTSIKETKDRIKKSMIDVEIIYLAAYICTGKECLVDIYFRKIDDNRVFEWNYIHNSQLKQACFDIDGVLCYDPTSDENDDGDKYLNFILNATPKLIPTRKIGYLVTSRLEKYREPTKMWLKKNGVEFGELFMMDLETAEERQRLNNHGKFKAEIYKNLKDAIWFVESEEGQAIEIASKSRKNVFCVGNQKVYNAHSVRQTINIVNRKSKAKLKAFLKSILPKEAIELLKNVSKR